MIQPIKKTKMTAKEKYESLENKKEKYTAETLSLYARIDELRKKGGILEQEIQAAYNILKIERRAK